MSRDLTCNFDWKTVIKTVATGALLRASCVHAVGSTINAAFE